MKHTRLTWALLALFTFITAVPMMGQKIVPSQCIWDKAPHCAFTDLLYYKNAFYCCFRESNRHVPNRWTDNGKIRVLKSKDGKEWQSFALVELPGVDLRDPKISITPDNTLMLTMGGSIYIMDKLKGGRTHIAFYDKELNAFSKPVPIELPAEIATGMDWLWKVTWYKKAAYGLMYQAEKGTGKRIVLLVSSKDGIHYNLVSRIPITQNYPNEGAIQFDKNGNMRIIVRCEDNAAGGFYGESSYPYTEWKGYDVGKRLGGPNILITPDGRTLVATRAFDSQGSYTALMELDENHKLQEVCRFPSGGDCSYPGLVYKNGKIYISYYSGHEKGTAIYFAQIDYDQLFPKP